MFCIFRYSCVTVYIQLWILVTENVVNNDNNDIAHFFVSCATL